MIISSKGEFAQRLIQTQYFLLIVAREALDVFCGLEEFEMIGVHVDIEVFSPARVESHRFVKWVAAEMNHVAHLYDSGVARLMDV